MLSACVTLIKSPLYLGLSQTILLDFHHIVDVILWCLKKLFSTGLLRDNELKHVDGRLLIRMACDVYSPKWNGKPLRSRLMKSLLKPLILYIFLYSELNKCVIICTWQLRFNYSDRSDLESYSVSRNALVSFFQQSISQRWTHIADIFFFLCNHTKSWWVAKLWSFKHCFSCCVWNSPMKLSVTKKCVPALLFRNFK